MNDKYFVSEKNKNGGINLRGFGDLPSAYRFYLEDVAGRMILKEVEPKVIEGGE